jgi:hypothetical protein
MSATRPEDFRSAIAGINRDFMKAFSQQDADPLRVVGLIVDPVHSAPKIQMSIPALERTFPFQESSFHFPRRNTPYDCDVFRQTVDDSPPPTISIKFPLAGVNAGL